MEFNTHVGNLPVVSEKHAVVFVVVETQAKAPVHFFFHSGSGN